MKIDSINTESYQPKQNTQTQGTESQTTKAPKIEKLKVQKPETQKTKILDEEAIVTPSEKQQENEAEVIKAIEKANSHIRTYDRRMEFSIHDETKQIMVKVIDTENDSVIREIPSEKVLDMVARMWELAGILVDEKI